MLYNPYDHFALPKQRTIHVRPVMWRNRVEVYVTSEDRKFIAKKVEPKLEMIPIDPAPSEPHEPTLEIYWDFAQEFLDAMFAAGMRPTAYKESYDQINGMRQAIDDIQAMLNGGIVFRPARGGQQQ